MSLLILSEILELFVNPLTADYKYSFCIFVVGGIYRNQVKSNYPRNKNFSDFFARFVKYKSNFEHFEKR